MQEALIFTDDNEQLRASYVKHVRLASIALMCASAVYGIVFVLGLAAAWDTRDSDDILVLTGLAIVCVLYGILAVRRWAHITFVIATVIGVAVFFFLLGSAAIELLDRVDAVSLILLALTTGQVLVTGLVARGLIFARKLRKLNLETAEKY